MRRLFLLAGVLILIGCGQVATTRAPASLSTVSRQTVAPTTTASGSAPTQPPIVGKWSLDRTCEALAEALKEAGFEQLIPANIGELVSGTPPPGPDPCVNALPPTVHSHTFWPDGRFNSYDQHEAEVDFGKWVLVDLDTIKIGEPEADAEFTFEVREDQLQLTPVIPTDCAQTDCLDGLGWRFAVAFPGESWNRQTSGEHVP
jgi:hypothetical protein